MAYELAELDAELWGERVRRARERAKLSVRTAAELVGAVLPTSFRSIARLEEEPGVPDGRRQLLAYVALLAYGFDPAGFGLGDSAASRLVNRDEVLQVLDAERQRVGLEPIASIRWYSGTAGREAA